MQQYHTPLCLKQKKVNFVAKETHFMQYKIVNQSTSVSGKVQLTTSKSITNRLLIIQALSKKDFTIYNRSTSKDTEALLKALKQRTGTTDIGPAGTAMRFLTAYFAQQSKPMVLTGSERMKNRPIEKLVNALRSLGANIDYTEKKGYPPLAINPGGMTGGEVSIDGSISSQYITALLLIAPCLPKGLILTIENKLVSEAYVELTLKLMQYMGINYSWTDNQIIIRPQEYKGKDITVEADWSSASYWYEIAAFTENADLSVYGLSVNSLQGDAAITTIFSHLGINTEFREDHVHLTKGSKPVNSLKYDFSRCPDLVQTLAVTCAMMDIPFLFTGTETLRIKETDRIQALQNELRKLGYILHAPDDGMLLWEGEKIRSQAIPEIETYEDHRMAMAFAPVSLINGEIRIKEPGVVVKSYPEYWTHLKQVGFDITPC